MATDWIKMRTDLYRDPKVSIIADSLMDEESDLSKYVAQLRQCNMVVTRNVMRNVTVGALVSIWGVMRQRGDRVNDDLVCKGVTLYVLDDIADLPGIGEAMSSAGWAVQTEEGVEFPSFFKEYNVDPAELQKLKNAERQRKFREKTRLESNVTNVTGNVTVTHREEKSREENINTFVDSVAVNEEPPIVDQLDLEDKINRLPACPHQKILAIYSNELPALAQPRAWEGARATALQARWKFVLTQKRPNGEPYATDLETGLDFFKRLFEYIRTKCPHLNGINDRQWQADLAWIVKAENFLKIIEGKYEREPA